MRTFLHLVIAPAFGPGRLRPVPPVTGIATSLSRLLRLFASSLRRICSRFIVGPSGRCRAIGPGSRCGKDQGVTALGNVDAVIDVDLFGDMAPDQASVATQLDLGSTARRPSPGRSHR